MEALAQVALIILAISGSFLFCVLAVALIVALRER